MQPKAALAEYGLDLVASERLPGASPRVLKVLTGDGAWLLKRSRITGPEIEFVHAAQEHLAANGFAPLLRFERTTTGRPYVRQGGDCLVLMPWVDAAPAGLRRRRELSAAVAKLTELHEASAGFATPADAPADRVLWGSWPTSFRARLDQLSVFKRLSLESDARTAFDRRYVGLLPYYWDQSAVAIAMLVRTQYRRLMQFERLRGSFCHHDLAHHNILFGPDDRVTLIDLDYCVADTRLHDIGSLIWRQCKRFEWDVRWFELVVRYYNRHAQRPLSQAEIEVVGAFLHWPQDFWQVGLQYYVERQPWPLSRFLSSLERKTARRKERERFLAAVRRRYAPNLSF